MKKNVKLLILCIGIPLAIGALSGWITKDSMETFGSLQKPPLSPPGVLFPIVWSILYVLMGISSYLIQTSDSNKEKRINALVIYGLQLAVNFFWSIWFFSFQWYLFSFIWLVLLWVLIYQTMQAFYEISRKAAYLFIPYLLWVTFAGYLNLGIYLLNG